MITKKEFEAAVEGYALIDREAKATAERWLTVFGYGGEWITSIECDCFDLADVEHGTIDISTEESYCSCCSNDYNSHSIPVSYIWDPDWEDRDVKRRAEEKRLEDERKAAKKIEDAKKREEKRYAKFLEMKEEYEG